MKKHFFIALLCMPLSASVFAQANYPASGGCAAGTGGSNYTNFGCTAGTGMTGSNNTFVGQNTGSGSGAGNNNTATGAYAMDVLTSGNYNAGFGLSSLTTLSSGGQNSGLGAYSLADVTSGIYNVGIGYGAGRGITTGNYNTVIGALTTSLPSNLSNTIILADGAGTKRLWIDGSGFAGFGTTSPTCAMDIAYGSTSDDILKVKGASTKTLIKATNTSPAVTLTDPTGLHLERLDNDNSVGAEIYGSRMGINVNASVFGSTPSMAGKTYATGGTTSTGLEAKGASASGGTSYGVNAMATGSASTQAYGVKGYAFTANNSATNVYGIYGTVAYTGSGTPAVYAGYFAGDVYTTGSYLPSDFKLKSNIEKMDGALGKIMQLNPSTYNYDLDNYKSMNLPKGKRYGFIAQELETVFPLLTKKSVQPAQTDENGKVIAEAVEFTGVNYVELIPVLTKAIQEQQAIIEELKAKVEANTEKVTIDGQVKGQKVEFNKSAVLFQNTPNPLNNITFIDYYLPASTRSAFIKVIDNNGKLVQAFSLSNTGYSQLEMDCSNLATGTYHYSLIIDNVIIDTKSMLVAKN